jgi:hypothetical protein
LSQHALIFPCFEIKITNWYSVSVVICGVVICCVVIWVVVIWGVVIWGCPLGCCHLGCCHLGSYHLGFCALGCCHLVLSCEVVIWSETVPILFIYWQLYSLLTYTEFHAEILNLESKILFLGCYFATSKIKNFIYFITILSSRFFHEIEHKILTRVLIYCVLVRRLVNDCGEKSEGNKCNFPDDFFRCVLSRMYHKVL